MMGTLGYPPGEKLPYEAVSFAALMAAVVQAGLYLVRSPRVPR
jgi:hypothetical protein